MNRSPPKPRLDRREIARHLSSEKDGLRNTCPFANAPTSRYRSVRLCVSIQDYQKYRHRSHALCSLPLPLCPQGRQGKSVRAEINPYRLRSDERDYRDRFRYWPPSRSCRFETACLGRNVLLIVRG